MRRRDPERYAEAAYRSFLLLLMACTAVTALAVAIKAVEWVL